MKKERRNLIYLGLIGGAFNIVWWFIFNGLFEQGNIDFGLGEILGYTAMLLALSTVFFGVKRHRDTVLGGKISFITAFGTAMIIVGIAAAVYVIGWEIYYPNFAGDFGTEYSEYMIKNLEAQGLSADEIALEQANLERWMERYKNPLYRIPITLTEILPLGLIVALVSSLILRKN